MYIKNSEIGTNYLLLKVKTRHMITLIFLLEKGEKQRIITNI